MWCGTHDENVHALPDEPKLRLSPLSMRTGSILLRRMQVSTPLPPSAVLMDGFNDTIVKSADDVQPTMLKKLTFTSNGTTMEPFVLPGLENRTITDVSVGWKHTITVANE